MILITITKINQILMIGISNKINNKVEQKQKRYKVMFVFDLAYAVFSISLFCLQSQKQKDKTTAGSRI